MDAAIAAMAGAPGPAITIAPLLNNVVNLAADLDACVTVADHLLDCANGLGGIENILNVPEDDIIACACCSARTPLAEGYSSCYDYLSDAPGFSSTDYEPYGLLYSICSSDGSCGASKPTATTTEEDDATTTRSTTDDEESVTATGLDQVTAVTSEDIVQTTEAAACWDMISMFESCEAETSGFARMPYPAQASCYCCTGSGRWVDDLGSYASECADWATTGEPMTVYPAATLFATFCSSYDDVCETQETATVTITQNEKDESTQTEENNESTQTETETAQETQNVPDAAVSVRGGYVAAAMAAVAVAVAVAIVL